MRRRLSIHLLLAFFLLLTQQLAIAHGSSHPLKGTAGESSACHICVISGQASGPITAATPDFTTDLRYVLQASVPCLDVQPALLRAFRPRAPPQHA